MKPPDTRPEVTFLIRQSVPGDEEGMIDCIRDEYGDTYFKRDFYDAKYLRGEAESGHITFLVAEVIYGKKEGTPEDEAIALSSGVIVGELSGEKAGKLPVEIAGMMILKEFYQEESMCEIATQIIRKKYRGHGLAMDFFEYGMQVLLSRNYSAAYCLPVVFHDVTQRLLQRLGLVATGFVLNVFDMKKITHSYQNGRNQKHSQGIQIRAVGKRDAGVLYIPAEHAEFVRKIYERLGVNHHIVTEIPKRQKLFKSVIEYKQDRIQSSLEIRIHRVGADLLERLLEIQQNYPLKGRQTANIFLNINDCGAIRAYEKLTQTGYFFTGLKPLCSTREYMVLHNPGEVRICFEDYVVSEEFAEILKYIAGQEN